MMTINTISTESKTLQMQLTGKQQNLNKLSSDAEMTASDKEKERRKIKQEIAELNRKLRQERLQEQEDNKELKKQQEKKKVIKEELLEKINPSKKEDSDVSSDPKAKEQKEDKTAYDDMPVVTFKNVLSADSSMRLSAVEEKVSHEQNRKEDVLASEIQSDEIYGIDTSAKKEALSQMRRKEPFTIESLHKKEDTSVPTMDLGAKIIIRE